MLYGERGSLTPDTNGPPSFLCMKNQQMNVTSVHASHTARGQQDIFVADYNDVQFK